MSAPETADHGAEPQSDLWTSDSERGATTSDPLPSGATDTPLETAAEPETPPAELPNTTEAAERDESGKFKAKGKGKPRDDPRARVEAATAKEAAAKEEARLAREETARYKAELEAARQPRQAAPVPTPSGPVQSFEQWSAQHPESSYEDYIDYRAEQRIEQRLTQRDSQQQQQSMIAAHRARITEAQAKYPDYQQRLDAVASVPTSAALDLAVMSSPHSGDLVYWLATHPEQCTQLAAESRQDDPVVAARWMQKYLEAQLSPGAVAAPDSARGVRPSAAKPPVNRVGGTATSTPVDPEDLDFGPEYIRAENAREKKRQEAGRW